MAEAQETAPQHRTPQRANSCAIPGPNPAKDEATLVLTREIEVPAWLTLYNAVGSEVLRMLVPKGTMRLPFTTTNIAPGLYHYAVLSSGGLVGNGKLTIVR